MWSFTTWPSPITPPNIITLDQFYFYSSQHSLSSIIPLWSRAVVICKAKGSYFRKLMFIFLRRRYHRHHLPSRRVIILVKGKFSLKVMSIWFQVDRTLYQTGDCKEVASFLCSISDLCRVYSANYLVFGRCSIEISATDVISCNL